MFDSLRSISSALRRARELLGWRQAHAADFLGVTQGRISQLEQRARPSDKQHERLRNKVADRLLAEAGKIILEQRHHMRLLARELQVPLISDREFLRDFRRQHTNRACGYSGLLLTLGTGEDVWMPPPQWVMLFGFAPAMFRGLPRRRENGAICCSASDVGCALEARVRGQNYKEWMSPASTSALRAGLRELGQDRLWNELAYRVPRWAQFASPYTARELQTLGDAAQVAEITAPQHKGEGER